MRIKEIERRIRDNEIMRERENYRKRDNVIMRDR